nr:uncharacterized protein LOC113811984 [Penaeus vannamei]
MRIETRGRGDPQAASRGATVYRRECNEQGWCLCYFPGELQGQWATQGTTSRGARGSRAPISYQHITITVDLVLEWGTCHARVDNNVILTDRTGGATCFRCISLNVISPKVVQVWTLGINACYTSESEAFSTCPPAPAIATRHAREIMLYSVTAGVLANSPSEFSSNCPYGFGFNVNTATAPVSGLQRTDLQCLGSWVGEDGKNYLAVRDARINDGDPEPQFRCGMFLEEAGTGRVLLAFSEDSTCVNGLNSASDGFETYDLTSYPAPPLPPQVTLANCTFPRSLLGYWHHTYVEERTIMFKDYRNYKSYTATCVQDLNDGERFIVYARTHCGDWNYNCMWLKRRSANILEFMLGLYPSEVFDDRLCDYAKFGDMTSWITQGKSLVEEPTACPIVGNYAGELPDAKGICSQLYSDCDAPEIMYYTVSECRNNTAIYEQREYQCLGQWEEEGRLYAFTYRRDVKTYECFVGVIKPSGVVFIKEAGPVCSRGVQPEVLGMKLHRKEACVPPTRASQSSLVTDYTPRATRPPWLRTTRPWKPITGRPSSRHSGCGGRSSNLLYILLLATLASLSWLKSCSV